MASLQIFKCFPRLPPELRSHIFHLTLPGPRIITLSRQPGSPAYTLEATASDSSTLASLYFTCKESHNAMRAHYLSFLHRHITKRYPVWMDPTIDTLYIPDTSVFDDLLCPKGKYGPLEKVYLGPLQHLAMEIPLINDSRDSENLDPDIAQWQFAGIKCFPALRKVVFVTIYGDIDEKYKTKLYRDFRDRYRLFGDVLDVQDRYDSDVLGKLEFEVMDHGRLCRGEKVS